MDSHYEWLQGEVPPEHIDRASPAGWCGNRGGGKSCASSRSCSGVTQSAALPPRAASSRTRVTALPGASSVQTKSRALPPGSVVSVAESICPQHQPALPQRFANHVDSRKRRRQEQPGLATTRKCLCGWKMPESRFIGDGLPKQRRKLHWEPCVLCEGPLPRARTHTEKEVMQKAVAIKEGKQKFRLKKALAFRQQAQTWLWLHSPEVLPAETPCKANQWRSLVPWRCQACGQKASEGEPMTSVCIPRKAPRIPSYKARCSLIQKFQKEQSRSHRQASHDRLKTLRNAKSKPAVDGRGKRNKADL